MLDLTKPFEFVDSIRVFYNDGAIKLLDKVSYLHREYLVFKATSTKDTELIVFTNMNGEAMSIIAGHNGADNVGSTYDIKNKA